MRAHSSLLSSSRPNRRPVILPSRTLGFRCLSHLPLRLRSGHNWPPFFHLILIRAASMGRTYENRKAAMAKTAGAKTKLYSKFGKEIYVCAKNGGPDPSANLSLRRLLEKAKKNQIPAHVIDKALDKAKGGGGEDYNTVRYEGFGPGNCMVIVDCLTDNNNRTIGDVRICFNKAKAKLG